MRSILAAITCCLAPLAAFAGPIQQYDFLTVDYEGTVNFVERWGVAPARHAAPRSATAYRDRYV